MIQLFHRMISAALGISEKQIGHTLDLLEDGATIPFISRYRKEATGGLDEVQIEAIKTHYEKLNETAKRKETIINTISEQGKMTPELHGTSLPNRSAKTNRHATPCVLPSPGKPSSPPK